MPSPTNVTQPVTHGRVETPPPTGSKKTPKLSAVEKTLLRMTANDASTFLSNNLRDPFTNKKIGHRTTVGKLWNRSKQLLGLSTKEMVAKWIKDADTAREHVRLLKTITFALPYDKPPSYIMTVPMSHDPVTLDKQGYDGVGIDILARIERFLDMRVILINWGDYPPLNVYMRPFEMFLVKKDPSTQQWILDPKFGSRYLQPSSISVPTCLSYLIEKIRLQIESFGNLNQTKRDIIDRHINTVNSLLRVSLPSSYNDEFEELRLQLEALKHGVNLEVSPNLSSPSPNASNMEDSIVLSSPASPGIRSRKGKTRTELLKELEQSCTEMKDAISYEDFQDMKKKQLQLVVRIGKPTKDGKRHCFYVKNIYGLARAAAKENLPIRDPLDPHHKLTKEELNQIKSYIRVIEPNAKSPDRPKKKMLQKFRLDILPVTTDDYPHMVFHQIRISPNNPDNTAIPTQIVGYIPADIDTESSDVNSSVTIIKIKQLFDEGKLFDAQGNMRVHIDKSIAYWMENNGANIPRKLALMVSELNQYM